MGLEEILKHVNRFPPSKGAEWGSGGIFGLRFYNKVLYFTLAFDGKAFFLREDSKKIYEFELVGKKPVSGGDTYNAVETVEEKIYFGGWIHAPVVYDKNSRRLSFENKYSHLHEYDTENDEVKLLWKDSIRKQNEYAGEVSDIIYDPCEDKLLICREDGHENTGIYEIDRKSGKAKLLNSEPCLKGCILSDSVFFGTGKNFDYGLREIHVLDLSARKWERFNLGESIDENSFAIPKLGEIESAYNRVFAFVRGGVFVGNPFLGEEIKFVRLFDFPNLHAPFRTNALPIGGGILIPFNAHHDAGYKVNKNFSEEMTNVISSPSLLVYITPPSAKIIFASGARITSLEKACGKILLGCNTTPNNKETAFDTGNRDIIVLDEKILKEKPPDLSISINGKELAKFQEKFNTKAFGGIPLDGYKESYLILNTNSSTNRLTVYEYDLALPLENAEKEGFELEKGRNVIDLSCFSGIVSFKLEKPVKSKIKIKLVS